MKVKVFKIVEDTKDLALLKLRELENLKIKEFKYGDLAEIKFFDDHNNKKEYTKLTYFYNNGFIDITNATTVPSEEYIRVRRKQEIHRARTIVKV
jgi:hypothetical protein